MIVWPWAGWFSPATITTYSFESGDVRNYIPICTNNLTCDALYGRSVTLGSNTAYEFLLYWHNQTGFYKFASHDYDWEFVVVYTNPNGTVNQVNYDEWHYYIGRDKSPAAFDDTNVLLYVDPDFHYFVPDRGIREGNVSWQIHNQTLHDLTDSVIQLAESQVGFDHRLFDNPFDWKSVGFLGRFTAFNSNWKAFCVVIDKKYDWIDFSDNTKLLTKWL